MKRAIILRYIESVTNYLETSYPHDVIAVILFGSVVVSSEDHPSTDVDLLVVMNDRCPEEHLSLIKESVLKIERTLLTDLGHDFTFIRGLQISTGMFTNFFVCRLTDFKHRRFSKVFNVNQVLSVLLAPKNSVWMSLIRQHKIIWGKNVFGEWSTLPVITKRDIIQSFLITWLLATGALTLSLIHPRFAKFSMEAMKWSLFTWRNYHHAVWFTPRQIIKAYRTQNVCVGEFLKFRENIAVHPLFPFWAWLFVPRLHFRLFRGK